jgi:dCTP deaminase
MGLISYNGLVKLVESGVINAKPENINGASIDITLGNVLRFECVNPRTVDIRDESLSMVVEEGDQFYIRPGEFCLAESREVFNLPNNIAAEYKLKSSMARNGLNHLLAGWCDPGWYGSTLTLELHNVTQYHTIKLQPGVKIGQMVFYEVEPVPEEKSYKTKGQYNNQKGAQESKGVR